MRQFFVLCAAAALLAGTTAAHAALMIGAKDGVASVTYAAETLLKGDANITDATDTTDTTDYHNLGGADLDISAEAGITAFEDDLYAVSYALEGMVFQGALMAGDLSGGNFALASGGQAGDKEAVFRLQTGRVGATDTLTLSANFAISAAGTGSITRTVHNETLADLQEETDVEFTKTEAGAGIIKVAPALKETATKMTLTATAASQFKKFNDGMDGVSMGSLGTLMVGFETMRRKASDGMDVSMLSDIVDTGTTGTGDDAVPNSTVSFTGDFSFASKVFVHGDSDCGAEDPATAGAGKGTDTTLASAATDLRMMDGTVVTDTTKAVNVADFVMAQHLCIMVDSTSESLRIPNTDAYTAMGMYKGIMDAVIGPMPMEQTMGMIERDGTTVHIPYMTTYEGYNQRIVLSNRGSVDAPFMITFRPEAGVKASGMPAAMGTLMKMSTMTLRSDDLVELTGGARTAATIVLEAEPRNIDVTSVTVNAETRGTDTVVHHTGM